MRKSDDGYLKCRAGAAETAAVLAFGSAGLFACGFAAYGNVAAGFLAAPLCAFIPRAYNRRKSEKRRRKLLLQFKDAILSISSSLSAGKSIENAFVQAVADLNILYCGQPAMIIRELSIINRSVGMNGSLSGALQAFSKRAGLQDITDFTDVFAICLKSGGNMIEVIRSTCSVINQKIEITEEINILAAEKMLSFKIMLLMPVVFIFMMMAGSPDYMRLLYAPAGNAAVTVATGVIAAAYFIGRRIAASGERC